jgi:uncharacterized membrane protein
MDILLALFGVGIALLVLGYLFVMPGLAFLRTLRLGQLADRLDHLEREVRLLHRERAAPVIAEVEEVPEALPVAQPKSGEPMPPRRRRLPPATPRPAPPTDYAHRIESWLGHRFLGWTAVVLLAIAAGFFLQYVFAGNFIGEQGQVTLGLLGGLGLCGAGVRRFRRPLPLFGQMLVAAGVVLLYLSTYASFGYYRLVPQELGGVFLTVLVVQVVLLAVLCDSPAIALMATAGALLTPLLLRADVDRHASLFGYLLVVNAGAAALTLWRPWRVTATLALVGAQGLFWGWYAVWYHPEKRGAALGFQLALFGIHVLQALLGWLVRRRPADLEGLLRQVLAPLLLAVAGYVLLADEYRPLLGTLAVALAAVYAGLAAWAQRCRADDAPLTLTWLATSLGFLAAAFPLQAKVGWTGVGWAVEGAALWCFGLRLRSIPLRAFGAVLLTLAAGKLLLVDRPAPPSEQSWLLLNGYALPGLFIAGCLAGAAEATRRLLGPKAGPERVVQAVMGLGGVLLVWLVLSVEVYDFLARRGWADRLRAAAAVSGLWAAYATLVVGLGLRLRSRPLRWTGLGLLGLALGKVVLVDTVRLAGLYRVAVYFALAVLMGAAAWGYQRFLKEPPAREEVDHAKT